MVDELGQCSARQTKLFKLIRRDMDRKLKLSSDGLGDESEMSYSSGNNTIGSLGLSRWRSSARLCVDSSSESPLEGG
jgi:hypothetical protein